PPLRGSAPPFSPNGKNVTSNSSQAKVQLPPVTENQTMRTSDTTRKAATMSDQVQDWNQGIVMQQAVNSNPPGSHQVIYGPPTEQEPFIPVSRHPDPGPQPEWLAPPVTSY